jgi:hypothetical protein
MAFDELTLQRIDRCVGGLCRNRTNPSIADQLRFEYEVSGHAVSVYEVRPDWQDPSQETKMGIARFRFIKSRSEWRLYWMRRDLKWHLYDPDVSINRRLEPLVAVVEKDQWRAFFG